MGRNEGKQLTDSAGSSRSADCALAAAVRVDDVEGRPEHFAAGAHRQKWRGGCVPGCPHRNLNLINRYFTLNDTNNIYIMYMWAGIAQWV